MNVRKIIVMGMGGMMTLGASTTVYGGGTGACCVPDVACFTNAEVECDAMGGTWMGADASCTPGQEECDGACCLPDGTCVDVGASFMCNDAGGVFTALRSCNDTPVAGGTGLRFDGRDSYAVGGAPDILSGGQSFTVEFWVKYLPSINRRWIMDIGTRDTLQDLHFLVENTGAAQYETSFGFFGGGPSNKNIFDFTPYIGEWTHVATTFNDEINELSSYINGVLVATTITGEANIATGPDSIRIGQGDTAFTQLFGMLDEIRVWLDVRSGDEIAATMSDSLTGDEENLLVYYPLDENEGAVAHDAVGDNDADLILGPSWLLSCGPDEPCPADIDGNGSVDFGDLLEVLSNWGPCPQ